MMLSGSMGTMGIALGVAIDVGIGKEIGATASEAGVDFSALLKKEVFRESSHEVEWTDDLAQAQRIYRVENYGFVTVLGSGDEVFPSFDIEIVEAGTLVRRMVMPDDFLESADALPRADFQSIKNDASEIERLWRAGIQLAMERK